MRVGPHRLYLRLVDLFLAEGLSVLRFDFHGLGDSEGSLPEGLLSDVYNHIEVGRFVDDTISAMDWMEKECGVRRFIVSGLCGGAVTGLLASTRDTRIAGLLALGVTPVLASRSANPGRYMTVGQLQQMRSSYVRKLLSPHAWLRLLTFRSDYRVIWASLLRPARRRLTGGTSTPPPPGDDNANPLFPPAFFGMLQAHRPMLLIFGGSDRLHFEFEEKFLGRHAVQLATLPRLWQVHTIDHANHVLSFSEWQTEMLDVSRQWLRQHFSQPPAKAESAAPDGTCL